MRLVSSFIAAVVLCASVFGQSSRSSSRSDSEFPIPCSADARWTNSNGSATYSRSSQVAISLSLMVHVGRPNCGGADVPVTVTYLNDLQEFICSGTIQARDVTPPMTVTSIGQTFNLEIRPFTQNDFLRWRNPPGGRGIQTGKRLLCMNLDGTAEVGDPDRQKASWMRVSVAVVPPNGGLSITELLVHLMN